MRGAHTSLSLMLSTLLYLKAGNIVLYYVTLMWYVRSQSVTAD